MRFGLERARPREGLSLARAALVLHRSPEEFAARFPSVPRLEQGRFVFAAQRHRFGGDAALPGRFSAEALLSLSESPDLHQLDASRICVPTLAVAARGSAAAPDGRARARGADAGRAAARHPRRDAARLASRAAVGMN